MNINLVRYKIEDRADFTRYIFDFILSTIGVAGKEFKNNDVDIYYGNPQSHLNHAIVIKPNKTDIVWEELIKGDISPEDIDGIIPFDIVNAIGFFLKDDGNKNLPSEYYDIHDRLIFEKSFQNRANIAKYPIVNLYIAFLKSLFERICSISGLPLWPNGKKCAIGLSHDADYPDKYAILGAPFFNRNANLKNNLFIILRKANARRKRLFDRNTDDYWLFQEIMDAEEKLGLKSTFFFAAMNQFGEWGSIYDVDYDIVKPKYIEAFQEIKRRRFEIALHVGYNAYLHSSRFSHEKQKLSETAGFEVKGLRHHFWHLGRNIALPFHPWNEAVKRPIKTIQLPIFCMDGCLFEHPIEVQEVVEKVKSYLEIIKQYGGIGVIDWHVRTSYPKNTEYQDWGKAYLNIIEHLAADKEIWATNLVEISSWLKEREEILSSASNKC